MAMREDLGLSWLLAVCVPALFLVGRLHHLPDGARLPADADAHRRGEPDPARADHRHPGGPGVRPRARRDRALRRGQRRAHRRRGARRPLDGHDVPDRDADPEPLQRRRAVVRRPPRRRRPDADRCAHGVPGLPRADPDVGDDGDLHADDGAARRGVRRPHRRGPRHRVVRRAARPSRSPTVDGAASWSSAASSSPTPAPTSRCCATSRSRRGPAQTTAIIGSTGAGKTTLVNLVPAALRRHRRARCTSTGSTYASWSRTLLWSRIGLVPQKAYLFSGTVASNLRYGKPDATEEEMWAALEIAQARDFVEAMPDGLDAPIAQGGTNVSGGQRQRLAIARALIREPEIYLFDDSFSALDLATDARLRAALAPGHPGRHGADRRAAGVDDPRRRPDPRARGRRGRRPRHGTTSCSRPARPTGRSSSPS